MCVAVPVCLSVPVYSRRPESQKASQWTRESSVSHLWKLQPWLLSWWDSNIKSTSALTFTLILTNCTLTPIIKAIGRQNARWNFQTSFCPTPKDDQFLVIVNQKLHIKCTDIYYHFSSLQAAKYVQILIFIFVSTDFIYTGR